MKKRECGQAVRTARALPALAADDVYLVLEQVAYLEVLRSTARSDSWVLAERDRRERRILAVAPQALFGSWLTNEPTVLIDGYAVPCVVSLAPPRLPTQAQRVAIAREERELAERTGAVRGDAADPEALAARLRRLDLE